MSEYTINYYENCYNYFIKFLISNLDENKEMIARKINSVMIGDFTLWLVDNFNMRNTTINTRIRGVRAYLYYLMEKGYINEFKVNTRSAEDINKEVYNNNELKRLLKKPNLKETNFADYRNWVIINFLLGTAARARTLRNIKIEDIFIDEAIVRFNVVKNKTTSEAELHILQARMQGGYINKAKRGELKIPIPIGFLYNEEDKIIIDPDQQIQNAIHLLFQTFRRSGSACGTVKFFNEQGLKFPRRLHKGFRKGELIWGQLVNSRTLQILHNPCYAGAYCFGKTARSKGLNGKMNYKKLKMKDWKVFIKDHHPAYITWDEYEQHQRILKENAQARGADRRRSPARKGPALIQGIVICGKCGRRMTVRYHSRKGKLIPDYVCQTDGIEHGVKICQHIPGANIDKVISDLLLEIIEPAALEVTMAVQNELYAREKEIEQYYQKQLERARYEVELAKHRYLKVDPDNRLVADELEADWNNKLRELTQLKEKFEKQQNEEKNITAKQKSEILKIATNFPAVWSNPDVSNKDRKRIIHLVIEDVTLIKDKEITVNIRFKGGATRTITLPKPLCSWEMNLTDKKIVKKIDKLVEKYTDKEIANILNKQGLRSGTGKKFTNHIVGNIRRSYQIKSRYKYLRDKGLLSRQELADKLGVSIATISQWRNKGYLKAYRYCSTKYLYEEPEQDFEEKILI